MSLFNRLVSFLLKLRNRHFFALDLLIWLITPAMALELRTDGAAVWSQTGPSLAIVTLAFLLVKVIVFLWARLYHRYWRYASIDELAKITLAILVAALVQSILFFSVLKPTGLVSPEFPRSVPLIESMLAFLFVGGVRYSVRAAERGQQRFQGNSYAKRVLIVGAGEAGLMIAKEMQGNPHLGLQPVGFVDDDPHKQKLRIRGINVMGGRHDIPRLVRETGALLLVIAVPKAPGKAIREITNICRKTGVPTKVIPGVYDLLDGRVSVSQLRDVQVEDLLRRAPVQTDTDRVSKLIRGARVMVTGAGGSIGSELCRQLVRLEPAELVLLGHGENSIFLIEAELRRYLDRRNGGGPPIKLTSVVADVRDRERLDQVFRAHRPQIIFHAAAHKHVPLMESNAADAVTNNVLGTRTMLDLAEAFSVERFVMISTDKAVNPTSVMGQTKRIAELLVHSAALRSGRAFVAVRFGNVLGSRGSVVEVFRQQIARGGPITVTHPDVKRYFMTIPEAVQLVLQAATMGQGGEVFALDMGEPVRIVDLARDLIRLSGKEDGHDLDIVFTGLRPGEKLFEELFAAGEAFERTEHEKIFVCHEGLRLAPQARCRHFHHEEVRRVEVEMRIDQLIDAARAGSLTLARRLMEQLVADDPCPECERVGRPVPEKADETA